MTNILTKFLYWIAGLFGYSKPADKQSNDDLETEKSKVLHILRGLPYVSEILDIPEEIIKDESRCRLTYANIPGNAFFVNFFGDDYIDDVSIAVGEVKAAFFGDTFDGEDISGLFRGWLSRLDIYSYKLNYNSRWMKLSLKAQAELPKAILKAKNLRDRFIGTLERIILVPLNKCNAIIDKEDEAVDSIGIAVKYKLLDETRYFFAYYKNNEIKKKLNGAAITNDKVEGAYRNAVKAINDKWRENGSLLHLDFGKEPYELALNGCKIFKDIRANEKPWATRSNIASEDFRDAMYNLMQHDVFKVRINNLETQIVMDPTVSNGGLIEFKPVFKTDVGVLATSISAERLNSRVHHEGRSR